MKSLLILLALSGSAVACDKGCVEYEGNCACDQKPAGDTTPSVKPSDEKPPSNKMPSYQREGIKADMGKPGVESATQTSNDYTAEHEQK